MYQIRNTPDGYVVEWHNPEDSHWYPLRNFGDHQGDAIAFRDYDCPRLPDHILRALIKQYNPAVKYSRISGSKFIKQ